MTDGIIRGTMQDDVLDGTGGSDIIEGGGGDDLLRGNGGGDTFVYNRGDGNDRIDSGIPYAIAAASTLVLHGISPSDLSFERPGADLVLVIAESAPGAGDAGRVQLLANPGAWNDIGVKTISFDDGTTWTLKDAFTNAVAAQQTAGDDVVQGSGFSDLIVAGKGDDVIHGNGGGDTFVYSRGDGHDVIDSGIPYAIAPPSTLVLHGVAPSELKFGLPGADITLLVPESAPGAGDGGSVRLLANAGAWNDIGVKTISFDDGTTWTLKDAFAHAVASQQTAGDDVIQGSGLADVIEAGKGDDVIHGNGGGDTFVYSRGDGHDVIDSGVLYSLTAPSSLVLHGVSASEVSFERPGSDLVLVIQESAPGAGDGGSVRLQANASAWNDIGVKTIAFDDGTTWTLKDAFDHAVAAQQTAGNDYVQGSGAPDVITGGKGDDVLHGNGGGDTFVYSRGDGHDVIDANLQNVVAPPSTLVLHGIAPGEVTFDRPNGDLVLHFPDSAPGAGDAGSIDLQSNKLAWNDIGVKTIVFDDGTTWSLQHAMDLAYKAQQTAGNDVVNGTAAADVIVGGKGNDVLHGGGGADTYVYARGDGHDVIDESMVYAADPSDNRIVFSDIASGEVSVTQLGADYLLSFGETVPGAGDEGSILIKASPSYFNDLGIQHVSFSDGVVIDQAQMKAMATMGHSPTGPVLTGTDGDDSLRATVVNAVLKGGYGADAYHYVAGDGNVVVDESVPGGVNPYAGDSLTILGYSADDIRVTHLGNDVRLEFAGASAHAADGTWHVPSDVPTLTIAGDAFAGLPNPVEKVYIGSGTIWTADDLRYKSIQDGGSRGSDVHFDIADQHRNLWGGTDDTTYTVRGGYGDINIRDHGGDDTLVFDGFSKDQVSFEINGGKSGIDFIMHDAAGNAVGRGTLEQGLTTDVIEHFVFADGESSNADVRAMLFGTPPDSGQGTPGTTTPPVTTNPTTPPTSLPQIPDFDDTSGDETWYVYGGTPATATSNHQVISDEGGNDTLLFSNIAKSQVTMAVNSDVNGIDFFIHDQSGAQTGYVTVEQGLGSGAMETLQFSDGTMSHLDVLKQLYPGNPSEWHTA